MGELDGSLDSVSIFIITFNLTHTHTGSFRNTVLLTIDSLALTTILRQAEAITEADPAQAYRGHCPAQPYKQTETLPKPSSQASRNEKNKISLAGIDANFYHSLPQSALHSGKGTAYDFWNIRLFFFWC